jgi:Mn-dependent DtxR family transcriptional regulator
LNLLLIISSLTAKEGYCFASNEYLAKIFNEHPVNISKKIKKLEKLGYIKIEYKRTGYLVTSRKIRLAKMLTAISKNANSTISKNAKYNNTSINNTSNKKSNFKTRNYNEEFLQSFYE